MKTFKLHWFPVSFDRTETIKGKDIADAFNREGIGYGALKALNYLEEIKERK